MLSIALTYTKCEEQQLYWFQGQDLGPLGLTQSLSLSVHLTPLGFVVFAFGLRITLFVLNLCFTLLLPCAELEEEVFETLDRSCFFKNSLPPNPCTIFYGNGLTWEIAHRKRSSICKLTQWAQLYCRIAEWALPDYHQALSPYRSGTCLLFRHINLVVLAFLLL